MSGFDKQLAGVEKKHDDIDYTDGIFFSRFCEQLERYGSGGEMPDGISSELRQLLEYRRDRLSDRQLTFTEEIMGAKLSETEGRQSKAGIYQIKHISKAIKRRFTVKNNRGTSYSGKENVRLCADIVTAEPQNISDDQEFCCPKCGNIAGLRQLEKGCESCGYSSFVTGLFPRVQGFFIRKSVSLHIIDLLKTLLVGAVIGFVVGIPMIAVSMIAEMPPSLEGNALKTLLSDALIMPLKCALLGAGAGILTILARLIYNEVKYSSRISKSSESAKSLNTFMKKYDRSFNTEHFEETVVKLIQFALYCKDAKELTVLRTNSPIRQYPIIDSVYTGFMNVKSMCAKENMCILDIEVSMLDLYDLRTRFIRQEDVFAVRLQRSLSAVTDKSMELKNTECPECKKHFDALSFSHCSICGREFPVWEHEWVVKDIKIK